MQLFKRKRTYSKIYKICNWHIKIDIECTWNAWLCMYIYHRKRYLWACSTWWEILVVGAWDGEIITAPLSSQTLDGKRWLPAWERWKISTYYTNVSIVSFQEFQWGWKIFSHMTWVKITSTSASWEITFLLPFCPQFMLSALCELYLLWNFVSINKCYWAVVCVTARVFNLIQKELL